MEPIAIGTERNAAVTHARGIDPLCQAIAVTAQLKHPTEDVDFEGIPPPFDHAVLAPSTSPENAAVQAAIAAFQPVQATLGQVARTLDIVNNL